MFLDLAKARYSCRSFQEKQITPEQLNQLLEAVRVAPTGCNLQPQRLFVCQSPEALAKIRTCTTCHFNAPTVIMVCYDNKDCWHRPFDDFTCGCTDAAIVTTHIILQAQELGLGTCWVAFFDPAKAREQFQLPANLTPAALIPIGYPAAPACPKHTQRKNPAEYTKIL